MDPNQNFASFASWRERIWIFNFALFAPLRENKRVFSWRPLRLGERIKKCVLCALCVFARKNLDFDLGALCGFARGKRNLTFASLRENKSFFFALFAPLRESKSFFFASFAALRENRRNLIFATFARKQENTCQPNNPLPPSPLSMRATSRRRRRNPSAPCPWTTWLAKSTSCASSLPIS